MPVYEFVCETCGRPFEDLVRTHAAIAEVRCPSCGSGSLRRKMSTFASRISGERGASASSSGGACSAGGT